MQPKAVALLVILAIFAYCAPLPAPEETLEEAVARRLGADRQTAAGIASSIAALGEGNADRVVVHGPLVAQAFFDAQVARKADGYRAEWTKKGDLPISFLLRGADDRAVEALTRKAKISGTRIIEGWHGVHSATAALPLFSLELRKDKDGKIHYRFGDGYAAIAAGKPVTLEMVRKSMADFEREHPDMDGEPGQRRTDLPRTYKAETLTDFVYLYSLGVPVGDIKNVMKTVAKRSGIRDELVLNLGKVIRDVPNTLALATLCQANDLAVSESRGQRVGGTLPPLLAHITERLPSLMKEEGDAHFWRFNRAQYVKDVEKARAAQGAIAILFQSQPIVVPDFTEGQLVQKNGMANPFIPYIGKKLSEVPLEVRRAAGFPDDFRMYHRTTTAHSADSVARGEAFVSTGHGSLLGGSAVWGPGLYLSASPNFQQRYGRELVTVQLDPNAVIGTDVDIFVGERDGLVAIPKTNDGLTYTRHGNENTFVKLAADHIDAGNLADAIELVRQIRRPLTADELKELRRGGRTHLPLEFYLARRAKRPLSPELQHWVREVERRPEIIEGNERAALEDLAVHAEFHDDPELRRLHLAVVGGTDAGFEGQVREWERVLDVKMKQWSTVRAVNAPLIVVDSRRDIVLKHIATIRGELDRIAALEGRGDPLRGKLFAARLLPRLQSALARASQRFPDTDPGPLIHAFAELSTPVLRGIRADLDALGRLDADLPARRLMEAAYGNRTTAPGRMTPATFGAMEESFAEYPDLAAELRELAPVWGIAMRVEEMAQRTRPVTAVFAVHDSAPYARLLADMTVLSTINGGSCSRASCTRDEFKGILEKVPERMQEATVRILAAQAWSRATAEERAKGADFLLDKFFKDLLPAAMRPVAIAELGIHAVHHAGLCPGVTADYKP